MSIDFKLNLKKSFKINPTSSLTRNCPILKVLKILNRFHNFLNKSAKVKNLHLYVKVLQVNYKEEEKDTNRNK